eukprot:TRINITY_DN331_c2_g1_i2.p1 TRINITY_DN331_c2_g1~~TRINITY_DN331_c2_g1_i2.p1  ORF type:complete len:184 (+),score=36.39 TRINITY_DN331_c2_g1_i2:178-729(+)
MQDSYGIRRKLETLWSKMPFVSEKGRERGLKVSESCLRDVMVNVMFANQQALFDFASLPERAARTGQSLIRAVGNEVLSVGLRTTIFVGSYNLAHMVLAENPRLQRITRPLVFETGKAKRESVGERERRASRRKCFVAGFLAGGASLLPTIRHPRGFVPLLASALGTGVVMSAYSRLFDFDSL